MSKFACKCGHLISDVRCPNEVTGWLLSDKSGDAFFDAIASTIDDYLKHAGCNDVTGWRTKHFNDQYPAAISPGEMIHDVLTSRFFSLTLATLECDACGRLWIQQKPDENHYHGYSPDDDENTRYKMLSYNSADNTDVPESKSGSKP